MRPLRRARPGGDRAAIRLLTAVTLLLIVIAMVGVVVASPLALGVFGGAAEEWERLSFIGQTYGAISALIAVFALVGVVVTLIFRRGSLAGPWRRPGARP